MIWNPSHLIYFFIGQYSLHWEPLILTETFQHNNKSVYIYICELIIIYWIFNNYILDNYICHKKLTQTCWPKAMEIYPPTALEATNLKWRCHQVWFPLEALRKNLCHATVQVLVAAGNPWCSLAYRCITLISALIITWLSFYESMSSFRLL